jgi:hypothetical protein
MTESIFDGLRILFMFAESQAHRRYCAAIQAQNDSQVSAALSAQDDIQQYIAECQSAASIETLRRGERK